MVGVRTRLSFEYEQPLALAGAQVSSGKRIKNGTLLIVMTLQWFVPRRNFMKLNVL